MDLEADGSSLVLPLLLLLNANAVSGTNELPHDTFLSSQMGGAAQVPR